MLQLLFATTQKYIFASVSFRYMCMCSLRASANARINLILVYRYRNHNNLSFLKIAPLIEFYVLCAVVPRSLRMFLIWCAAVLFEYTYIYKVHNDRTRAFEKMIN